MRVKKQIRRLLSSLLVSFYSWGQWHGHQCLYMISLSVTGYGGYTNVSDSGSDIILDKLITVRFDASLERDMPWEFRPVERQVKVKIGETALAFYEAYNPTNRPVAGSASYNVTPYDARFFNKIDCFAFKSKSCNRVSEVQMPVTFYVDPELVNDRDAKFAKTITLSYTFYEIDLPVDEAKISGGNLIQIDWPSQRGTIMAHVKNHDYHILNPSLWPFIGAVAAFVMLFGAVLFFHDNGP